MKVDFFIAGVQKSGTTALDTMLRRHPQIQMARVKEVHYFDDESIDRFHPSYDKLHDCFDWSVADVIRGEATPIYTYWPNAIWGIARYNYTAKLIVGLRHPSYRAFSHWRMETSRGAETLSFSEAIRVGRWRVANAPLGVHRVYSYVERGYYHKQIAHLAEVFPRRVHYFRTDRLWSHPEETLNAIQRFLGVDPMPISLGQYIVPVQSADLAAMSDEDADYLHSLYCDDILASAQLSGCDISDWTSTDYVEPMARPG